VGGYNLTFRVWFVDAAAASTTTTTVCGTPTTTTTALVTGESAI